MYQGHRVISTCPAGRRRYLEILSEYLLRQRHLIDEHHWWVNTLDEGDIAYIRGLCQEFPDFFKFVAFPYRDSSLDKPSLRDQIQVSREENGLHGPLTLENLGIESPHVSTPDESDADGPNGWRTVHRFFGPAYHETGVLYLRFDDDVCYVADDAVERLLEFRVKHREYLLVFPQIVNNWGMDHIRQRCGLIEYAPFLASIGGNAFSSSAFAEASHWTFLRWLAAGRLEEIKSAFRLYIGVWRERFTINCFAWWGEDMSLLEIPEEDEHFLTKVAPKATGG